MRKPLKTLQIDAEKMWGGGQTQVAGLCSYLRDQGHEVNVVCRPGSKLQAWALDNGLISYPVDMKSFISVSSVMQIRSIIARVNPDIVHMHTSRAHVLGAAAARLAGSKVVIATRRNEGRINMVWPNTSAYGKWITAIVAVSGAVRESLIQSGVEASKTYVIFSGTDTDRFQSAAADPDVRQRLGISPSAFIVGSAATLAECKGMRYLIESAGLIKEKVHLVIAGDGEQRAELESLAHNLQVSASFLGFSADMAGFLAGCDAFAMPSLEEGLGVAALEAMAAGKPVVASAVGGLRESVQNEVTGFLVPPADPESLADAIKKLIDNPEISRSFGLAGQARVREYFSLKKMAQNNESLYYSLLGL